MNAAAKAFRRGSVRFKSFSNGGHSELNLVISGIREIRSAAKQLADAQETVWKDLSKWASKERNLAIRESVSCMFELNRLWTEVQGDFIDQLNKFKYSFEMIMEGELSVDKLRERLSSCEEKETKLLKDEQKATTKSNIDKKELGNIKKNLIDTQSLIKSTKSEICEKTQENEAVKVIRVKESLLKLSESHIDLAHKSIIIFEGVKTIASGLPITDQTRSVHDIRYRGSQSAKLKVIQVKEAVKTYKQRPQLQPGAPPSCATSFESPPPAYTQIFNNHYYPNSRYSCVGEDIQQDFAGPSSGSTHGSCLM